MAERVSKRAKSNKGSTSRGTTSESLFSSTAQEERYMEKFAQRSVSQGRFLDVEFFESENFEIMPKLKEAGLYKLINLDKKYNETLVKVFYSNLTWDNEEKCLLSEVKGTQIRLTHEKLGKMLGAKLEGCSFTDHQSSLDEIPNYDAQVVLRALLPPDAPPYNVVANFQTSNFEVDIRFLHYIVCGCLFNKGGNTSKASAVEQFAMYCIISNTKFNIPSLIIEKMLRCTRVQKLSLPYASLITWIMEKHKVNMDDCSKKAPVPNDGNTLSRSGHTKHGNAWVTKMGVSLQREERRQAHQALATAAVHTSHSEGPSSEAGPQDSSDILTAINRDFDAMNLKLDTMNARIAALELTSNDHTTGLEDIKSHLENMY